GTSSRRVHAAKSRRRDRSTEGSRDGPPVAPVRVTGRMPGCAPGRGAGPGWTPLVRSERAITGEAHHASVQASIDSDSRLQDRRAEREALAGLIARAREGTSGTLVVRGEAGVGKTALLDVLLAGAAGCRVVRTSGVESEMELA